MTLQIGNIVLENRLFVAPMAGVTDRPFRMLCRELGAGNLHRNGARLALVVGTARSL